MSEPYPQKTGLFQFLFMKLFLLLFFVLISSENLFARIGETLEQLKARYGEEKIGTDPLLLGTSNYDFNKDGYRICVSLKDDRSILEGFLRKDKTISNDDIQRLLKDYVEGVTWSYFGLKHQFISSNRQMTAFREPGHPEWFRVMDDSACESLDPNTQTLSPDRSVVSVLILEGANALEWVLAPLEQTIPGDIRQNLTMLREALLDEGAKQSKSELDAYRKSHQLCNSLLATLDERDLARAQAGMKNVQADAKTGVNDQALKARRNYMMGWPQYQREAAQREELLRQNKNGASVEKEQPKLAWIQRVVVLRRNLDGLYADFRKAMRAIGATGTQDARALPPTNLPDGLVLYFPFDSDDGTTIRDWSGRASNGLPFKMEFQPDRSGGQAFKSDERSYIEVPHEESLTSKIITVAAWVNPSTGGSGYVIGKDDWEGEKAKGYVLRIGDGVGDFTVSDGTWRRAVSKAQVPPGQWTHLAGVFDGSSAHIYVNGNLDSSQKASASMAVSKYPITIGSGGFEKSGRKFQGGIDNVMIFATALSADQIQALMRLK